MVVQSRSSLAPCSTSFLDPVLGARFCWHSRLQGLPRPARGSHGSLKVAAHVLVKPCCTFHESEKKMPLEDSRTAHSACRRSRCAVECRLRTMHRRLAADRFPGCGAAIEFFLDGRKKIRWGKRNVRCFLWPEPVTAALVYYVANERRQRKKERINSQPEAKLPMRCKSPAG